MPRLVGGVIHFSMENNSANYLYDFGDNWEHTVVLKKSFPEKPV